MWYLRETRKDEASKWNDYEPLDFPEVEGNEKYLRAIEKIEGYWNTNVQLYAAMVMQTKTINFHYITSSSTYCLIRTVS